MLARSAPDSLPEMFEVRENSTAGTLIGTADTLAEAKALVPNRRWTTNNKGTIAQYWCTVAPPDKLYHLIFER